jgi:hypothetical protein
MDLPFRAHVLDNIERRLKAERDVERPRRRQTRRLQPRSASPRRRGRWQDSTVSKLAASVYEAPVSTSAMLADALEEAGCDDRDVLEHRGLDACPRMPFADAILGKK